jgi:hypothetical protein
MRTRGFDRAICSRKRLVFGQNSPSSRVKCCRHRRTFGAVLASGGTAAASALPFLPTGPPTPIVKARRLKRVERQFALVKRRPDRVRMRVPLPSGE